jgi:hypothetical protein
MSRLKQVLSELLSSSGSCIYIKLDVFKGLQLTSIYYMVGTYFSYLIILQMTQLYALYKKF